ncbi:glutathione S-transferase family protein [Stenoxybacter acetivorans]|uniref:glutathione S-transferase family protein n=1 Tax=Stenoxybacter acetivorans TaxID=422441 RepID=UPI000566C43F|nr:glutathione binding-like protein [Stenoxybacter acetivorans]
MLKLYYLPGACSIVPHTALVWSGLDFVAEAATRELIKSPEYLALNPQGQVPLLVDGDWTLTQNTAIIDYLNDLVPQANIHGGGDARSQARARQWLAFANSDLHPAIGLIFGAARLADGDDAQAKFKEKAKAKVIGLYASINNALANSDYLSGSVITAADVYVYTTLRWAESLRIDLSQYAHLPAFYQRVENNAGVQTVLKQQGLI